MARKIDVKERLKLWAEYLSRPEGVTYQKLNDRLCKRSGDDYSESLRKDLTHIRQLLAGREEDLLEEGKSKKVFRLSSYVDLVALHECWKNELIYLLTHTRGFLPEEFIKALSGDYRNAQGCPERTIVDFETDYEYMECMDFFADIYHAIVDRQTLLVHYHRMHRTNKLLQAYVCPDYLKQYRSAWYVFGMVKEVDDKQSDYKLQRIPLAAIDEIEIADKKAYPYRASNRDYKAYFSEVIGLELDENCEQEHILLRVSNHIYDRIASTPIHSTQERCKALDDSGHKGIELFVRRNKELIRLLLSFGSDVEVVSPAILRRQLERELKRMLTLYQG